jgi:3-dehydroquinate dehydratase/shikimate dehydrogenase
MTQLCAAIFVTDEVQAQRDIALAAEAGADVVELRIDALDNASIITQLLKPGLLPAIVTCRPTWEGGQSRLDDLKRGELLTDSIDNGARFVDIELETLRRHVSTVHQVIAGRGHAAGARLIVSSHKFTQGRPDRLMNILLELYESPADIAKIVWTARTLRDNLEAFEILQSRQKPTIALCMGEAGLISRVLAKKFGAFLTFASLEGTAGTAPGQISITDMKRLYRWDAIRSDTKVYGVVGSPVGHSMSPAIHNSAFDQTGFNGIYLPLLVNPGYESFKAFMESFVPFPGLDLSGLSVTIPHKENALRYLKAKGAAVEPLAERIGAVNTIVIDGGKLSGFNTDYAAILDSITIALGITREQLANCRVAVIGAGGTGRTAVAALAACGATVVVYNRTRERADALAAEFTGRTGKVVSAAMEKLCDSCCQIYLNTTSIGMHPNVDQSPFDASGLGPEVLVFDAVYNPVQTQLLKQAAAGGSKTVSGIEMFVRQAGAQFALWTKQDAPLGVMRGVVEARLRARDTG